jgi:hypothetical protein
VADWSTESSASITKGHLRKFFLQSLPFDSARRFGKSMHEQEETFLLGFFGLQTGLDQIYKDAVGAGLPGLGQGPHTPGDPARNRHALTNRSFRGGHVIWTTPFCTTLHHPEVLPAHVQRFGPLDQVEVIAGPGSGTAALSAEPVGGGAGACSLSRVLPAGVRSVRSSGSSAIVGE